MWQSPQQKARSRQLVTVARASSSVLHPEREPLMQSVDRTCTSPRQRFLLRNGELLTAVGNEPSSSRGAQSLRSRAEFLGDGGIWWQLKPPRERNEFT